MPSIRDRVLRTVAILLLVAAAAECYWRGPLCQKKWRLWDYGSIYASARALLHETNPYDVHNCEAVWHEAGGATAYGVPFTEIQVPIVPPSTYAALEPLAVFRARWAMRLWMYGELVLILIEIGLLARLAGWRWNDWRTIALAAGVLAFGPIHYSWVSGQTSIPVFLGATLALCCLAARMDLTAGALLGVATAIKPPMAAALIVYLFLVRRPRAAVMAIVVATLIFGVAVLQLQIHHIPWMQDWQRDLHSITGPGTTNDFSRANPLRYDLVCLQLLISQFTENRPAVNGLAIGVTGVLCLLYLIAFMRCPRRQNLLLTAGGALALGLLPFYHRNTDAIVLLVPLAWALARIGHKSSESRSFLSRALPFIALILIATFLLPEEGGHALAEALNYRFLPWRIWDLVILPLHVWALLLLCVTLIAGMAITGQSEQGGRQLAHE